MFGNFREGSEDFDSATVLGACIAFGLLLAAIILGGGFFSFLDLKSLLIVVGGTVGATLISFPLKEFLRVFATLRLAIYPDHSSGLQRVGRVLEIAQRARTDGELSIEGLSASEPDGFFRKGLELLVDQIPAAEIRRILELELANLEDRHRRGAELFQTMGAIAPAMGLIGTLIGLVRMLETLENPSEIGPGMALALLTTFYGATLAHLVFLPIAGKLRARSEEERLIKEMTLEGIVAVAEGVNPMLIERRLHCFLPPEERYTRFGS